MRRTPLILIGVAVAATAVAAGGGWYALRTRDPLAQARGLMQQGDFRSAQLVLRDLVRSRPDLAEAHLRLGLVQLRLGDPIAAEHEMREATAHGADEKAIRPLLAQALAGQNKSKEVLSDYTDAGLDPSQSADIHIARSVAATELKQFDVARTEASTAQTLAPSSPYVMLNRARVEAIAGDLDAAGRAADQALALDPHLYPSLALRARILVRQRNVAGAIAAYDALLADPSSKGGNVAGDHLARADLLLGKGDNAAARLDVDAALKDAPRSPLGNYMLSLLNARAGQWRAADEAINTVGARLEAFPRGDILLATVKANVGQPQQALDAAEHFNNHNPKDVTGVKLLANIQLSMGREAAAVRLLTPWAAVAQPDAGILVLLSRAYAATGQTGNAQATLQKAAAGQKDPAMLARLARTAIGEGNPALGADLLQVALGAPLQSASDFLSAPPQGGAGGNVVLVNAPDTAAPGPNRADTAAALVVASLRAGQADRAAAALETLRSAKGDPEQLDLLTGAVKLAQFDLQGARTSFETARDRNPASVQAAADLAHVMILQGQPDEAATVLRAGLAKKPAEPILVTEWAELAMSRNAPADAIAVVDAAQTAAPDNANFKAMLAGLYLQTKQPAKALALANALPPDTPMQLSVRADAQRALGKPDEALASWQALLAKTPQDTALRRRIAGFLLADGREDAAAAQLQRGLEARPDDAGLQADTVALVARKDGLAAGLSRADGFAARSTGLPTLLLKGDLLMLNRKFADAAAAYAKVRGMPGISPEDTENLLLRQVSATQAAGDPAAGTKLLQDWLEAHPGSLPVTEKLAENDLVAGRLAVARTRFDAVLAGQPNNAAALNNLAWIEQQGGDFAKSQPLAARAYAAAPTPQAADTLGWALFKTGHAPDSLTLLRVAAVGQPGDPTVQYHYAAALQKAGDTAAAKTVLKPALDAGPFKERDEAEQLMRSLGGP